MRLAPNGEVLVEFERSANFDCGEAADIITVTVDQNAVQASPEGYVYQSDHPVATGPRPVLLLQGRIVVGEEIPFGAGTIGAVAAPLLSEARIEARTPDPLTGQRFSPSPVI